MSSSTKTGQKLRKRFKKRTAISFDAFASGGDGSAF